MSHLFYVIMHRRQDGALYADLHKTNERMYLLREDAEAALAANPLYAAHFHVVELVAVLSQAYRKLCEDADAAKGISK